MRRWINSIALLLAALALSGCFVMQNMVGSSLKARTLEGTLTPPPAHGEEAAGWSLTVVGSPNGVQLEFSQAQVATARALQGKLVSTTVQSGWRPLRGNVFVVRTIAKDRLTGTLTRVPISTRYPMGWRFVTSLSVMPLDVGLDPSAVMPAAEQLAGKRAVFTGSLVGSSKGIHLVADTLEPL